MTRGRVLFIHPEDKRDDVLHTHLRPLPLQIEVASGFKAANSILSERRFHAIILQAGTREDTVEGVLRFLRDRDNQTPVIVVAEQGESSLVERYHAAGAFDFMVMPVERHVLIGVVRRALLRNGLAFPSEDQPSRTVSEPARQFPFLVGTSEPMTQVLHDIAKVAEADSNVCVYGESGTGKELVARAIHYSSRRANRPMIISDCTAIPAGLMESEMFGHVRGSFTSAAADRDGVFQMADGGSLFLDEVGELSLPFQAKLLRVIQCREFRKVGGKDSIKVDVRIIAATNKILAEMVDAGKFREDLFFRLDVLSIVLPPLRQRKEDIPLLVDHFIQRFNRQNQRQIHGVSPRTMGALLRYDWPGNVRELENCVERAAVMSESDTLNPEDVTQFLRPVRRLDPSTHPSADNALPFGLKDVEREAILRALRSAGGDKVHAARLLGISLRTLYYKLKEIDENEIRPTEEESPGEERSREAAKAQ